MHNSSFPNQDKNGDVGGGSGNPIFHEFFVSHSPLLQSQILNAQLKPPQPETHTMNHFLGVPIHGQTSDFSSVDASDRFIGRKRNNPDFVFMGLPAETMPQKGSDSLESSQLMKMHRISSFGVDHPRTFHPGELSSGMQPPKPKSTSRHILGLHMSRRGESVASEWESPTRYSSRIGHFANYVDRASTRDSHAGPSILSPSAADEGSGTGIKGSGVLSAINVTSDVVIRSRKPSSGPQSSDHESSDSLRQSGSDSAYRQMTIFYTGQAHVFDHVHPKKADVIMSLAGSEGRSWSTTYSPESTTQVRCGTHIPNRENQQSVGNAASPRQVHGKLPIPRNSIHGDQISTATGSMRPRSALSLNPRAVPRIDRKREVE